MRTRRALATLAVAAALAFPASAQIDPPRPSPKATVMQTVGMTDVTVTYSRPGVKGRVIWGDLVPWDKVWRTGANEATSLTFSTDVTFGGQKLSAGTYSVHTIPAKDGEWTVILNKDAKQWGSYSYDEKKDAARVKVKPASGEMTEWLTFSFPKMTASSADLEMAWEKVRLRVPIETDAMGILAAKVKEESDKAATSAWQIPLSAANFLVQSKGDLAQAHAFVDRSMQAGENFFNWRTRARVFAAEGKSADAVKAGGKALEAAKTSKPAPSPEAVAAFEKEVADWKAPKK